MQEREEFYGRMSSMHRFAFVFLLIIVPQFAVAHPGNTAADGCHYCRTNCAKWGEVQDERHCHAPKNVAPTPKAVSSKAPTSKATAPKTTPKKTVAPTIDECSASGLLKVYKDRKAKGEKMDGLSMKAWWKKCPENVRKEVFKKIR